MSWREQTLGQICDAGGGEVKTGPFGSQLHESDYIEAFFEGLKEFVGALSAEEQRGVAEGLTEEELAIFDILTQPEPVLTKAEEAQVKKVCRGLLATLKREKLVLDWREKQQAKAAVMQAMKIDCGACWRSTRTSCGPRRWPGPTHMCTTTMSGAINAPHFGLGQERRRLLIAALDSTGADGHFSC